MELSFENKNFHISSVKKIHKLFLLHVNLTMYQYRKSHADYILLIQKTVIYL